MDKKYSEVLILSGFIWFITSLHYPILPYYFMEVSFGEYAYGLSYALGIFFMFLVAPMWLRLVNQGYRTYILNISAVMFSMLQITLGYITNIYGIVFVRAISSIMIGAFEIGLYFTILDIKQEDDDINVIYKYIGFMSIFSIAGIFIGGFLGTLLPIREIFYIQGVLMFVVSILIKIIYDVAYGDNEIVYIDMPTKISYYFKDAINNKYITREKMTTSLITVFLIFLSYSNFNMNFNYYLAKDMNIIPFVSGSIRTIIGLISLFLNMNLSIWLVKNTDKSRVYIVLLLIAIISGIISFKLDNIMFVLGSISYFMSLTLIISLVKTTVNSRDINIMIDMMIIFNVVRYLAEMTGGLTMSILYGINSKLPFLISVFGIVISLIINLLSKNKIVD